MSNDIDRPKKPRVAIVYHYFQHFRRGIFDELAKSDKFDYVFYADEQNMYRSGVEPWQRPPGTVFHRARCILLPFNWMWQTGLIRLALRKDVDAIIFFGNAYYLATWASSMIGRLRNKRIYFWTQGWRQPLSGAKARFRNTFYRQSHGLLVYGQHAKQIAIANGFSPEFVHVIFNSLDYSEQRALREQFADDDLSELRMQLFENTDAPIAICCTRLVHRRRLDWLIEAAGRLRTQGHCINLLFVGEGPEHQNLEKLASDHHVPVHFFGPCYDEKQIARLYRISTVTVAPGMVGLTAMQSMAYGVPVISHGDPIEQMPEYEAIMPGSTGDLFEFGNVDDLCRSLLAWTHSRAIAPRVRRQCIAMIEQLYDPQVQRAAIERALEGHPAVDRQFREPPDRDPKPRQQ